MMRMENVNEFGLQRNLQDQSQQTLFPTDRGKPTFCDSGTIPACRTAVKANLSPIMHEDLEKIVVTSEQIDARVRALAAEISRDYADAGELTIIAIINGALMFTADLMRHITVPVRLDCMRVSSYRDDTSPVQKPQIIDTLRLDIRDRHVLVIDDILDTGFTFERVMREIRSLRPATARFAALLEKKARRAVSARADYVGFDIPDEFVIGYGLDFAEHYRNLPYIGVLRADCQNPPEWS
jgi:hypoxanthine phosphoribosyltransferase